LAWDEARRATVQASDVMTTKVITVTPDTPVEQVARILLEYRISGVPVVEASGRIVGIVTEGDLMRRPELETARRRPWWLGLIADERSRAEEYVKSHGSRARDVMTRNVVTVGEETPVSEIARLLERHRIKRVPVVRGGELVGIVSRANLIQGLAAHREAPPAPARDDRSIREQITRILDREGLVTHAPLNVIVTNAVVELWGFVDSREERDAIRVAAEGVPGVVAVEDQRGTIQPWVWGL
jgi:CBS domain-containing protein